jgi:hypothetical protein
MTAEVATWCEPDGTETDLVLEWNAAGRIGAPRGLVIDDLPTGASVVRSTRTRGRRVALSVWVEAPEASNLWAEVQRWAKRWDPARGQGFLKVESLTGDVRRLPCYVETVVDNEVLGVSSGPTFQRFELILFAPDGVWESVTQRSFAWGVTGVTSSFLPLGGSGDYFVLGDSALLVAESIVNGGDVNTWPVWTISGPVTDFTLTNSTTGDSLVFDDLGLLAGESVQIDTRPGVKAVVKSDGTSLFSSLSSSSALGALVAGGNDISVTVTGGTGSTGLALAFRERWLTP